MLLLDLIILLFAGGALAWWSESRSAKAPRWLALAFLSLGLLYLLGGVMQIPEQQFSLIPQPDNPQTWLLHYRVDWIPRFGINFELAMDGLSLILVTLTLLLGGVAVVSSWDEISFRPGFFQANLLWTLAGVVGVFLAMDLFLFFLFWEVMLVPMYLLIAIWGHEQKAFASMKFFLFTQFSGLLLLLAILVLASIHANNSGSYSFSYFDLLGTAMSPQLGFWVMLGFFIAFTVKLPAFPFHTWLPDAHTQAPTAGSVILAGILLKTGAYGLLRFTIPLFPQASVDFAPVAMALGAASVIYGAVLAFAQTDFKRLVAYSSVSHMGFVLLGLYAWNILAVQGAVMQMVAHGLSTAALFMTAGALQQRLHTRDMRRMGGLWHNMPRMGATAMFFALASLGLPGLGNFVGEFLVLVGLFAVNPWLAVIAAIGLITAAVYALIMMQHAFQGTPDPQRQLTDYGPREMAAMGVLIIGLLWLGLYPQPVLDVAQPVLESLLAGGAP
ncbi:MAG: NADH-quinone oxidoreductase subunit M [Gammaproteobacteria bacterium]|nr:NADH-quinone oxidoreductase subunit M [Gammaproteobacteria bacterium]